MIDPPERSFSTDWKTWGPTGPALIWEFAVPFAALWGLTLEATITPASGGVAKAGSFLVTSTAAPGFNTFPAEVSPFDTTISLGGFDIHRGDGPIDVLLSGGNRPDWNTGSGTDGTDSWVLSARVHGQLIAI